MSHRCFPFAVLLTAVFFIAAAFAQEEKKPNPDLEIITARALEIAPKLGSGVDHLIPPMDDRVAWETYAALDGAKKIVSSAEKLLAEPIAECPEALYKEFFDNGNRDHAQKALGSRQTRLATLALAELVENKGRFLSALNETLLAFCDYPSWVLPAHDPNNASVYDGRHISADLWATHIGGTIGMILAAFGDSLPMETSERAAAEVNRRVLAPFEKEVREGGVAGMWWVHGTNNWNPVCQNGTVAAALSLCPEPERRAWFMAAAERFVSDRFFLGFPNDGYCSEGIGYWNYGYGNYAQLAEIMLRVSDGAVNIFDLPKSRAASLFPVSMEIKPGFYASFADCSLSAKPDVKTLGLLSRRIGLGLDEIEKRTAAPTVCGTDLLATAVFSFFGESEKFNRAGDAFPSPLDSLRSEFADAGILICRAAKNAEGQSDSGQLCAVFKGGNNNELHNHNDVGSYGVICGKTWLVLDPGGEKYTRRTFSSRRYEGQLLNSFGHSVPRIGETLQKSGKESKAIVLEKTFGDEKDLFRLNLSSAYPVEGLTKLLRTFEFFRAPAGTPNRVVVTDEMETAADKPQVFETAVVTFAEVEVDSAHADRGVVVLTIHSGDDRGTLTVRAANAKGEPVAIDCVKTIVGENDEQVPNKPTRFGFAMRDPISAARFTTEIAPAKE